MELSENHFIEHYNRFVDHYNDSSSGLSAFSELTTIRQGIERSLNDLHDSVNNQVSNLEDKLTYVAGAGGPNIGHVKPEISTKERDKRDKGYELRDSIIKQLKRQIRSGLYISSPENMLKRIPKLITDLYKIRGKQSQKGESVLFIHNIIDLGKKIQKKNSMLNAIVSVNNKITDAGFPKEDLLHFNELPEKEQEEMENKYKPHHNTRDGLVEDLTTIIKKIKGNPNYFHDDGAIKHTSVAKYAVEQDWFSDKHGPNHEGLYKHIKGIYKSMNST